MGRVHELIPWGWWMPEGVTLVLRRGYRMARVLLGWHGHTLSTKCSCFILGVGDSLWEVEAGWCSRDTAPISPPFLL